MVTMVLGKRIIKHKHPIANCPFCGGVSELAGNGALNWVRCTKCYIRTAAYSIPGIAINKWNMRCNPNDDKALIDTGDYY